MNFAAACRQLFDINNENNLNDGILNPRELKESIEDCVFKQRKHCMWLKGSSIHNDGDGPTYKSQISFFCGHHEDCDVFESDIMLQRALHNFEKRFAVTGVLEHINMSIEGTYTNAQ